MTDDILHGVQIVELGEAEGHDFTITEEFLDAVVEQANALGVVKVRINHPEGRGDVASIVGQAENFRLDGKCVRADVTLFDVPEKSRLLTLAKQAGHLFGMSLDFAGETIKKAGQKLKTMTCEKIFAVDFVDCPAATRALFSAGEDKNHWRLVGTFAMPKVDSNQQVTTEITNMADKPQKKTTLAEPAPIPAADDGGGHPEPDGDEGYEKIMASLSALEARLAKLEGVKKEELAEDEPPVEDEEKETEMATMAAKVCSIMLAKVGIKPRPSAPVYDEPDNNEPTLSAEEIKLAKLVGVDEKQFAANLAAANKRIKL